MKIHVPCPELRLLLTNLSSEHQFSTQTTHNAIGILMNPCLPPQANQHPTVIIAALWISHKLHDVELIALEDLCGGMGVEEVLEMEMLILKCMKYKVCVPLLIDRVWEYAEGWDNFSRKLTCIHVGFNKNPMATNLLSELTHNIIYLPDNQNNHLDCLAAAIVYLSLRQVIRLEDRHKKFKQKKFLKYLFEEYLAQQTSLTFPIIKKQLSFVTKHNFILRDITNQLNA